MAENVIEMRGPMSGPVLEQDVAARLRERVVGQEEAIGTIAPYVQLYESGLAPAGRPAGVFLLLGPTGTGKTRTVEALAEALHGSDKHVLRVDCGEFQLEHEVAKLIGAPPGYLGHRETQPMLNQQKVNGVASERCGLSLVLFDEIEKAAPSMARLLLGVLDKASLKLGDNTAVNFERCLIFMTSNLGAREMMARLGKGFGLAGMTEEREGRDDGALEAIALRALRRRFSPEFVNRVDRTITYKPLGRSEFSAILDIQLAQLREHVAARLGVEAFRIGLTAEAREFLLTSGTSAEYGARELKRSIHRHLMQPMAGMVVRKETSAGGMLLVGKARGREGLTLRFRPVRELAA